MLGHGLGSPRAHIAIGPFCPRHPRAAGLHLGNRLRPILDIGACTLSFPRMPLLQEQRSMLRCLNWQQAAPRRKRTILTVLMQICEWRVLLFSLSPFPPHLALPGLARSRDRVRKRHLQGLPPLCFGQDSGFSPSRSFVPPLSTRRCNGRAHPAPRSIQTAQPATPAPDGRLGVRLGFTDRTGGARRARSCRNVERRPREQGLWANGTIQL